MQLKECHLQVLNPEGGGPLARVVVITDEDGQYFLSLVIHWSVLAYCHRSYKLCWSVNLMQILQCPVLLQTSLLEKRPPPLPSSHGLALSDPTG